MKRRKEIKGEDKIKMGNNGTNGVWKRNKR